MSRSATGPSALIIGGRYRVIRALATGGMGNVYEAENTRTLRRVAIKTIRPEVAQRASVVQRFEREAQAAGQLRHPNIVDVLDLGDDPEHQLLFIVQEFLVGGDLGACLRVVGTLGPRAALATLLPIMDALTVAHAQGVVHRDLKPDNIFLHETPQGVIPKLIDFGIAKLTESAGGGRRVSSSSLVGSPIYMSPEQARADVSIDARTDVWSMGVVLYETLTGKTPFEGANAFALFTRIATDAPIPLATLGPHLPTDLAAVVQRAVTKDREARWSTMADFAAALRACECWRGVDPARASRCVVNVAGVSREESPLRPATELSEKSTLDMSDPGPSIEVISEAPDPGLRTSELSPQPPLPASHRPRRAVLAALAVLIMAAVGGVLLFSKGRGDPQVLERARVVPMSVTARPPVAVAPQPTVAPPDVSQRRAARVRRPSPRRIAREPVVPAAPIEASPLLRGFNGAPIVE